MTRKDVDWSGEVAPKGAVQPAYTRMEESG